MMEPKSLARLLSTTKLPKALIASVVRKLNGDAVFSEKFRQELRLDHNLSREHVDELRFAFDLGELVFNCISS